MDVLGSRDMVGKGKESNEELYRVKMVEPTADRGGEGGDQL